ncbi:MAG TPA: 2-phospho-L-lactate transferase CofD family protein [Solirubrobacteraceae bacterium]|nr:2-phospho-L-lactate transferase CofD family protein [Solirubrobacteraceae bacterium]
MEEHENTSGRVVVLGGGRGLASVLPALRSTGMHLTVITSIAAAPDGVLSARQRLRGPVEDLRRSLEALSDEDAALLHAIRRPLTVDGLGQHPLGDLTLTAAADALGGYGRASMWLGEQLGIDGSVLPATVEPARHDIEEIRLPAAGQATTRPARRLRFADSRTHSPEDAVAAINDARCALLAPGGLYRNILSTCAVPDLAAALATTSARVAWIANLEPDPAEAPGMSATDHLLLLRLHEVRVDAVLYDPTATLSFDAAELSALGVASVTHPLASKTNPGTHDPQLLRAALTGLLGSVPLEQPAA